MRRQDSMRVRRVLTVAAASASALAVAAIGIPIGNNTGARADAGCSAETIRGAYALGGAGFALGSPWAGAGRVVFDGAGHLSGNVVEVYGGVIDDADVPPGTYSLNPDCHGFANIETKHDARVGGHGARWRHEMHRIEMFVAAGGQRVSWVVVDTYPVQQPDGLPEVADPSMTFGGYLDRM